MNLVEFLDRLIAPGNWLALAYKGHHGLPHRFYKRDDLNSAASFLLRTAKNGQDVWYALASFKNKGSRKQDNAQALKTFWLDADIPKAFASEAEVVRWVGGFSRDTGIPRPNIWVKSGYGLHLYWSFEHALDKAGWQPYAEALKAALVAHGFTGDSSVVADAARILRPIETLNFKNPAQPVPCFEFHPDKLTAPDYPDNVLLDAIAGLPQYKASVLSLPPRNTVLGNGSLAAAKAGLSAQPRDFAVIAANCAQVGTSLNNGGLGDSRDVWWRLVTLSTFCTDGRDWAHKISKADPRYTMAETDKEYDQAVDDHIRKGIGAPLCNGLDEARPGICQACPHFNNVPSPFSLGIPSATSSTDPDELPIDYRRNDDVIERHVYDKQAKTWSWLPVVSGDITAPILDYLGGPYRLNFAYHAPTSGSVRPVAVVNDEFNYRTAQKLLAGQGVHVQPDRERNAARFLMAWIDKLRRECRIRSNPPPAFGWFRDTSGYLGFSTGGMCYRADGSEEAAAGGDPRLLHNYTPVGSLEGWRRAASFIAGRVPELHTAIGCAFGAPLMEFTSERAAAISFVGKSGVGKTSAFQAGAAVWGTPVSTMLSLDDSETYKFLTVGHVRSLPLYWDEAKITNQDRERQLISELHKLTQGRDRGRGTADVRIRAPAEWVTLFALSTNDSVCDIIADQRGHTDATLLRSLEITITHASPPYDATAGRIVKSLDLNYGEAGRAYARAIAAHASGIGADVVRAQKKLGDLVNATDSMERFYLATAAAILTGAKIASSLGIFPFDLIGMRDVLCRAITRAREKRQDHTPPDKGKYLSGLLDEFLNEHSQEMVVTRTMAGFGRVSYSGRREFMLRAPMMPARNGLAYQLTVDDRLLRIDRNRWKLWCRKRGLSPSDLRDEMKTLWGLEDGRGALGAGTPCSVERTYYYEIPLSHPDLIGTLYVYLDGESNIVPIRP